MPKYIIPFWFESHGKIAVEAGTIAEAIDLAEKQAWRDLDQATNHRIGDVTEIHFTESLDLDTEGVVLYNQEAHPEAVLLYQEELAAAAAEETKD